MTAKAEKDGRSPASRRRLAVWGGAAALMVLPVLAIRVVDHGPWDLGDFLFLAMLLAGVGIAYELAARVPVRSAYTAAAGFALAAVLLNIWINLAVGMIGSEDNPANWLYAGVIGVAAVGAMLARLRPLGMARAMAAAAAAQGLVFVVALVAGVGFTGPITVFFAALWLLSAWLFRRAAEDYSPAEPGAERTRKSVLPSTSNPVTMKRAGPVA